MNVIDENKFCISRSKGAVFTDDQFRTWLSARDLGLAEATNGAFGGQVTRAKELGHSTGAHYHKMTFQMVYVLKGWVQFWYEGEGEFLFEEGDPATRLASSNTKVTAAHGLPPGPTVPSIVQ